MIFNPIERLQKHIDFWRNNQNDPHGIGNAVIASLEAVRDSFSLCTPDKSPAGQSDRALPETTRGLLSRYEATLHLISGHTSTPLWIKEKIRDALTPPIDNKYVEPGCEQFTGVSELTKGPSNPVKSYVTTDDRCSNCGAKLHLDKEIGEFQDEVRALVIKLSGAPDHLIDGKGSDAGWQEFTLAEIGQGFAFLKETMDRQHRLMVSAEKRGVEKGRESDRAQLETARDLLSRCPGIRTDETQPYWDEVQAFLGREGI